VLRVYYISLSSTSLILTHSLANLLFESTVIQVNHLIFAGKDFPDGFLMYVQLISSHLLLDLLFCKNLKVHL